jgi:hypothetical protein
VGAAVVTQNYKTTWHRNPVSGHEWPTHENIESFSIVGGSSTGGTFRSLKKAEEHAEFLNRWCFMIHAKQLSISGREFTAEASELGFAPGVIPRSMLVLDCPEKGQHRSFDLAESVPSLDGEVTAFYYEETDGPNRKSDRSKGLGPFKITVFND